MCKIVRNALLHALTRKPNNHTHEHIWRHTVNNIENIPSIISIPTTMTPRSSYKNQQIPSWNGNKIPETIKKGGYYFSINCKEKMFL